MNEQETPQSAVELTKQLVWMGSLMQRWGVHRTMLLDGYRLNFSQVGVLYWVRYGVTTPGALAKTMMVTPRAITANVDGLVEQNLLQRQDDPHDRRVVQLRITSQGEQVSRDIEERVLSPMVNRITDLPPEEFAALQRAADILGTVLHDVIPDFASS